MSEFARVEQSWSAFRKVVATERPVLAPTRGQQCILSRPQARNERDGNRGIGDADAQRLALIGRSLA